MESSDKQTIKLHLQQPLVRLIINYYVLPYLQNEPLSMYVEVVGLVESNLSLSVSKITNWGSDFGTLS